MSKDFFVYSPHAHARIRSIDAEAAAQAPGVIAVLTAEEWAADGGWACSIPGSWPRTWVGLQGSAPNIRRWRGIACVMSASASRSWLLRRKRERAMRRNWYRSRTKVLPAVVRPADALRPGSALVHDGAANNTSFTMSMGNAEQS